MWKVILIIIVLMILCFLFGVLCARILPLPLAIIVAPVVSYFVAGNGTRWAMNRYLPRW